MDKATVDGTIHRGGPTENPYEISRERLVNQHRRNLLRA